MHYILLLLFIIITNAFTITTAENLHSQIKHLIKHSKNILLSKSTLELNIKSFDRIMHNLQLISESKLKYVDIASVNGIVDDLTLDLNKWAKTQMIPWLQKNHVSTDRLNLWRHFLEVKIKELVSDIQIITPRKLHKRMNSQSPVHYETRYKYALRVTPRLPITNEDAGTSASHALTIPEEAEISPEDHDSHASIDILPPNEPETILSYLFSHPELNDHARFFINPDGETAFGITSEFEKELEKIKSQSPVPSAATLLVPPNIQLTRGRESRRTTTTSAISQISFSDFIIYSFFQSKDAIIFLFTISTIIIVPIILTLKFALNMN